MEQQSPYQPPATNPNQLHSGTAPQVIIWYKVYLAILALMYFLVAALGVFLMVGPFTAAYLDGMSPKLAGGIYAAIGLVFMIPPIVGFFLPKTPGAWVYHLVLICLGMTGCTIVGCIPLLIFWIKPEVQAYFGKTVYVPNNNGVS